MIEHYKEGYQDLLQLFVSNQSILLKSQFKLELKKFQILELQEKNIHIFRNKSLYQLTQKISFCDHLRSFKIRWN